MPETYTVLMRKETFYLTRDQVEFDSPNYFTYCFLGDFTESQIRTLQLSRDPELFQIIIDYLSGYKILPLQEGGIPKRMSLDTALQNLLIDAEFYLLDRLVQQLRAARENTRSANTFAPSSYVFLSKVCSILSRGRPSLV
jgi:hypothetical protein